MATSIVLALAIVATLCHSAAASIPCPGSGAWFKHASCQTTITFAYPCSEVFEEISARITSTTWVDPHNKGTYKVDSEVGSSFSISRTTGGGGQYTDKILFESSASSTGCTLTGCSESQVTSVVDYSTNYCNIRNLVCGSSMGCKSVQTDIDGKIDVGSCSADDDSKCDTVSEAIASE
eukprot:m.24896 g.24896  ORF g.24896 m.24896 type:complete len:178 (-) comp14791_c0_seq1:191-724(-)